MARVGRLHFAPWLPLDGAEHPIVTGYCGQTAFHSMMGTAEVWEVTCGSCRNRVAQKLAKAEEVE